MGEDVLGTAVRLCGRGEWKARRGREGVLGGDLWGQHEGSAECTDREGKEGKEENAIPEALVVAVDHLVESRALGVPPNRG